MACCILIFGLAAALLWPLKRLGLLKGRKAVDWTLNKKPDPDMKLSGSQFSWAARVKSFRYALSGLAHVLKHEHNARIHLGVAVMVIGSAAALGVSLQELSVLILVIMAVCFAETINTAFEHLCDVVSPEHNPSVKFAKDIAAGAVLICAIGAGLVGLTIFEPYLAEMAAHMDHKTLLSSP